MKGMSFIIPYYKGEKTIFNTIDSVFRAYEKVNNKMSLQVIVIIDSMDDKETIFNRLTNDYGDKLDIICNEVNCGVASSRNKAKNFAKEEYLLFLDQDDCLEEDYFTIVLPYLEKNLDVIVTNGFICNLTNNKKAPIFYVKPNLSLKAFLRANKVPTPGMVIINNKLAKVADLFSGCSEEFKGADDWAAYLNLFLHKEDLKFNYIPDKIFNYNLHGTNYSNNWEELNESAIATSKYFLGKFSIEDDVTLNKRIDILRFENAFKLNKNNKKFLVQNIDKIINYYFFHIVYLNRIMGFLHKKVKGFYN